jgi:hypothetical protein
MRIEIVGTNPPGRSCSSEHDNIHVGIGSKGKAVELFPGDAKKIRWELDVRIVAQDGALDFRGPFVDGKRGERFIYLNWVNVADDGTAELFRRAKLVLDDVDPELVAQADGKQRALVATVNLTDGNGNPTCARVRPPAIDWSLE